MYCEHKSNIQIVDSVHNDISVIFLYNLVTLFKVFTSLRGTIQLMLCAAAMLTEILRTSWFVLVEKPSVRAAAIFLPLKNQEKFAFTLVFSF